MDHSLEMEIQTINEVNKQTDNQKMNPKKNKKREKRETKRLISLFRGPKVEHKLYRKSTEVESNAIKQTIIEIIDKNSSLKLHQKKKKNNKTEDKKNSDGNETKTNDFKLTNELILGLNAIIRSIEKKTTIGVIITNPLAIPLEDNIIELCSDNQIPCVSVLSFDDIKSCLNISSLSAIAFKPNVNSNDSLFYKLYLKFQNIFGDICLPKVVLKGEQTEDNKIASSDPKNTSIDSKDKSNEEWDLINNRILFELFYSKKYEDNYFDIMERYVKSYKNNNKSNEFVTQESLIKISPKPEVYFPETNDSNIRFSNHRKFPIIKVSLEDQPIDSNDDSFAESLIDTSDQKTSDKNLKRKLNNQKNESQTVDFKAPRIVRLEPSSQRIVNRKQRKQMKKQNKQKR